MAGRRAAQQELTRLLAAADTGTLPEPSTATIAEYLRAWLGTGRDGDNGLHELSPKTIERYRELAANQIAPHLGNKLLQKLTPTEVKGWHKTLLSTGAKGGGPLSTRTVGHAHRVLHRLLQIGIEDNAIA